MNREARATAGLNEPPGAIQGAADPKEHAVVAHNLTRRFGGFTAVDGINLAVKRGEIFGFLGSNGAGKTTAIRMFCGLLAPSDGAAWVNGLSVLTHSEKIKRHIGYMSQAFSLYDDLTVGENISFFGGIYGMHLRLIREKGAELLKRVGLERFQNRITGSLPLGYKQRLALGSAVLHDPAILFLDEPTGGVDPVARRSFWDLIYGLADSGTTIFVTTHYMDEAEYCDRVSIMAHGRIAALDSPSGLKETWKADTMQDVFLKVVKA